MSKRLVTTNPKEKPMKGTFVINPKDSNFSDEGTSSERIASASRFWANGQQPYNGESWVGESGYHIYDDPTEW